MTIGMTPVPVPKLQAVLLNHRKFVIGKIITITRRNGDTLCWVKHEKCARVIGKIDDNLFTFWRRPELNHLDVTHIEHIIRSLEANPLVAAKNFGLLSGICCSCGRDLTAEDSVAAGIGPICAQKF